MSRPTLYRLPVARGDTAAGIYLGAVGAVAGIVFASIWATTQLTAYRLRFHPALGAPLLAVASPYRELLPPRAGGIAFVLSAMGGILHSMLDVTIAYRARTPTIWDFCCGRLARVVVDVRKRAIEGWMAEGDYASDAAFRERFQAWLGSVWAEKDRLLLRIAGEPVFQAHSAAG